MAFDLGAESGRALLGSYDDGRITMREIHRFANEPVQLPGSLHWDVLRLWSEIERGLSLALAATRLEAIGIDTWGVDFALLGEASQLLGNPFHYRDTRTDGMLEQIFNFSPTCGDLCRYWDPVPANQLARAALLGPAAYACTA
ncbi:MAG: hypothetical protein WKF37_11750 [Bryobacteraceae bacterium]